MDNSGRVGAVTSSSGVSSSDSGDGSGGKAGDVHGVGGGDIGVATGNDGSVDEGSGGGDNGSGDSLDLSDSGGSGDDGGGSDGVGVVGVAKAVVVSVGVAGVASESGVSKTVVTSVAESVVSVGVVGVSLSISLSLPLGNMDDSSRVGDVTSSTGVSSSNSRDGSWGVASHDQGNVRGASVNMSCVFQDSFSKRGGGIVKGGSSQGHLIFNSDFISHYGRGFSYSIAIGNRCNIVGSDICHRCTIAKAKSRIAQKTMAKVCWVAKTHVSISSTKSRSISSIAQVVRSIVGVSLCFSLGHTNNASCPEAEPASR